MSFISGYMFSSHRSPAFILSHRRFQSGFCDHSVNWTSSSLGNDGVGTEAPLLFFIPVLLRGTQEGVSIGLHLAGRRRGELAELRQGNRSGDGLLHRIFRTLAADVSGTMKRSGTCLGMGWPTVL